MPQKKNLLETPEEPRKIDKEKVQTSRNLVAKHHCCACILSFQTCAQNTPCLTVVTLKRSLGRPPPSPHNHARHSRTPRLTPYPCVFSPQPGCRPRVTAPGPPLPQRHEHQDGPQGRHGRRACCGAVPRLQRGPASLHRQPRPAPQPLLPLLHLPHFFRNHVCSRAALGTSPTRDQSPFLSPPTTLTRTIYQ